MTPERQKEIQDALANVKRISDELTQIALAMHEKRYEMSKAFAAALPQGDAEIIFAGSAEGVDVMQGIERVCMELAKGAEEREKIAMDFGTKVKAVAIDSCMAMVN